MSRIFEHKSEIFTTNKDMNHEKDILVDNLCRFLGKKRETFRLQRGNIQLVGITHEGKSLRLTSTITRFPHYIKQKNLYKGFFLYTKLQVQNQR